MDFFFTQPFENNLLMFHGSAPTHQLSVSSFECVAYASLAAFVNFSVMKVSFRSKSVHCLARKEVVGILQKYYCLDGSWKEAADGNKCIGDLVIEDKDTESKMEIENREEEAGLVTKHAGFQYGLSPFAIKI